MSLILPSRFASQPQQPVQIDRANPLTRGLMVAAIPFGATFYDCVTGRPFTPFGAPPQNVNREGRNAFFTNSLGTQYYRLPLIGMPATDNVTVASIFAPNGLSKQGTAAAFAEDSGNNAYQWTVGNGGGGTNEWDAIYKDGAGTSAIVASTTPTPVATVPARVMARYSLAAKDLWVNGVKQTSSTTATTSWGASYFQAFSIGAYDHFGTKTDFMDGWVNASFGWSRYLTDAEVRSFYDNPWQVFKAPVEKIWVAVSGGAGTNTLVAAPSSQANNSGTGAASQTQVLVGAVSAQANSSAAGVVTQAQVLSGAASSQANAAAAAALTQTQQLAGASSSQANVSASSAVTQAQVLSGANATQANSSSTAAATQIQVLSGASSTQANASGTGAASQVQQLVGAASSQSNASSVGAVTVPPPGTLVGAPSTQGNASSAGAISQVHKLTGAGASQSNASSTGQISQIHQISGAASSQVNGSGVGQLGQLHGLTSSASAQSNGCGVGVVSQNGAVTLIPNPAYMAMGRARNRTAVGNRTRTAVGRPRTRTATWN